MVDPNFTNSIAYAQKEMLKITLWFTGGAIIFAAFARLLYYLMIERGWRTLIVARLNNSKFLKTSLRIINPDFKDFNFPTNKTDGVTVEYSSNNGVAWVKYEEEKIPFEGQRALLLLFFYSNKDGKRSYKDYNAWLENHRPDLSIIDSRDFRATISEINGRLVKESNFISSIIEQVTESPEKMVRFNFYQFKPKMKNNSDNYGGC